jgi:hypothetical protein
MRNHRRLRRAPGVPLAGAFVAALILWALPVSAQIRDVDVTANSELQLLERADAGEYQRYSITITTIDGSTVLTTNKDGIGATHEIAGAAGIALWRELLGNGLESLGDAAPSAPLPDQSRFTMKYRAGSASGEFTAYAVDSLADARYRAIVRAVLAFAGKYSASGNR